MTQFIGHNYIGGQRSAQGSTKLHSVDAATGETLPQVFFQATPQEVDAAAQAAAAAYPAYRALSAARRAQFLDAIADELDALSDHFVELVCRETALPAARTVYRWLPLGLSNWPIKEVQVLPPSPVRKARL